MKIAIIVRSLKFGGMERAACNQADAFIQAGHDVTLIYFSNKNKEIKPSEEKVKLYFMDINKIMKSNILGFTWNITCKILNAFIRGTYPLFKGIYTSKVFEKEFKKLEANNKFDLILIRGQGSFEQIWKFKDNRSVRINVNVSTRNNSSFKDSLMSKAYFNNCHVNCNSEGGAIYYQEKFKREGVIPKSLKAIRNPFFKDKIIKLSQEENIDIPREPYILGVGRLVKAKNFELLINTYIFLKRNYNFSFKLVLVGDGSQGNYLKEIVKNVSLENEVIFAGYQSNPYNWMANAQAFVLTSKFEGLCGVLIEAMCCGTRVVATKSPGGVTELMNGEKLSKNLVEADVDLLSKQIVECVNKPIDYYYEDYSKILNSLEPQFVVNEWLKYIDE